MSLADVTSARSSPPPACPECDTTASVTSDLHKYQVACTCSPGSAQYACADEPGPAPPAKTDTPPALPPRPPAAVLPTARRNTASVGCNGQDATCRRRKYAWWCVGCGALAAALGGLLAAQHILVRAYTASPHHLETVPAAVPAAMLVLTGVCIMSLARRRNRYSYMIKVVGACCLMCALTCVLVTITTTVIHMNKLQTLKFCEYTKLTRTCTCFSMPPDSQHDTDDEGVRCVFEGVSECGVVHGALYWCLRGVFALSVSAVLVCIFSCMLAYQLLSHERKKMYWEQLELRCRSLYRAPPPAPGCGCCQCGPQPAWGGAPDTRLNASGRIGNLYSPNPSAGRKTSAWSWFPWPRSNSQNSRGRMGGVPQSGDSAYGFCDTDVANQGVVSYDERAYQHPPHQGAQGQPAFQPQANFPQSQGNFQPGFQPQGNFQPGNFGQSYQEHSGSYDAQTGVWGPPPPYSPQGRGGSRHHLHHQDPATATLLHHHHIDVHRTHTHEHNHTNMQPHTCARNSYLHADRNADIRNDMIRSNADIRTNEMRSDIIRANPDMTRVNQDMIRANQDISRMNQDIIRANPDMSRMNQDIIRANPDISRISQDMIRANPELARISQDIRLNQDMNRINPEIHRINPDISRINPDISRMNPEMGHMMYPNEEMEMTHIQDGRFNTLRGHLVPYRCQRIGMSASNLHRDSRIDDNVTIECIHQKSASKVSDQSSDSCPKQGKENLGFQNDKHSPIRASMQDCRVGTQNAESEVYFADVSSCCNVSVKAECCMNPNVSALVGTIENHPESTSESDTGSFTLTRQQRPQPQVGSKRRPRQDKHKEKIRQNVNNSLRLTEHQIEQLNLRMSGIERVGNERIERVGNERVERIGERVCERMSDRDRNERLERIDPRLDRNEMRMSERHDSRDRLNERNDSRDRLSDRNEDRINDSRICERINDSRISDRLNDSRMSDRMNESRISERMNETRLSERMSDRLSDSRFERMNDSRISERLNDSRLDRIERERMNDSRISDRMNDSRISDRMNDSRISDRMNETRLSERMNDSRINRMNESMTDRTERMSDLNSSIRIEGSPKMRSHISPLRMPRSSPKNLPKETRQTEAKVDFFVPPPPVISPLSPGTEESLLSDDDRQDQVYSNDPEGSKCLGPDSQYEPVREEKVEALKGNHHHCYSDTNTMDSGWQSGSEKQVTD